ncbi:hypothetical protein Tco_0491897 [Tanacetum coccineum]
MTIPNELINDVIRGADYYDTYLKKVAKHQRYLAGEEVSDPESPAPKPAKPTKQAKPKATKQPTVSKTTTKQPTEKKRKSVSESSEAPPLAKCAKAGKVVKKRIVKSSKQLVDKFIDEGIPAAKPSLEDTEEAILPSTRREPKRILTQLKGVLFPLWVIQGKLMTLSGNWKFQPLPRGAGKGKRNHIFQRHTPVPSKPEGHEESSSLYAELGLYGSDMSQAGPNPDEVAESQAYQTPNVIPEDTCQLYMERCLLSNYLTKTVFSYGDQIIDYKPVEANMKKTTADTPRPETMVFRHYSARLPSVILLYVHRYRSLPRPASPMIQWHFTTTTTHNLINNNNNSFTTLNPHPQQRSVRSPSIINVWVKLEDSTNPKSSGKKISSGRTF